MNLVQIPGPVEAGRRGNVEDQLELENQNSEHVAHEVITECHQLQGSAGRQFLLQWLPPPNSNSPSLRIAALR